MKLSTPRWWYVREGAPAPVSRARLTPISWIWAAVTARRLDFELPDVIVQEDSERCERLCRNPSGRHLGPQLAREPVQLHVLPEDPLDEERRAGVSRVEGEHDLLFAAEVVSRGAEELFHVLGAGHEPLLRSCRRCPSQPSGERELVVVLARE